MIYGSNVRSATMCDLLHFKQQDSQFSPWNSNNLTGYESISVSVYVAPAPRRLSFFIFECDLKILKS